MNSSSFTSDSTPYFSLQEQVKTLTQEVLSLRERAERAEQALAEISGAERSGKVREAKESEGLPKAGGAVNAGRQTEEALRESEERYRTLFTHMTEGFAIGEPVLDEDGRPCDFRFLEFNDSFVQQTGLPRDIAGKPATQVLPKLEPFWIETYCHVALTGKPARFHHYNQDTQRHYEVVAYCPVPGRFAIVFTNITERKQAEEELSRSEQRLRQALDLLERITEGTQDLMAAQDLDFRYIAFNKAYQQEFKRIFGKDLDIGTSMIEALSHLPEDQKNAMEIWGRAIGGESYNVTKEFGDPRRDRRTFDIRFDPMRDAEGNVVGAVEIARDVTDRVRTEVALRESETRYRELVQNANSAILRWRRDGTITFFNEYAQAFFGYRAEEAIGRHVSLLIPQRESSGTDLTGLAQDIINNPQQYVNHSNENICRNGRRVWMTWTNKPIFDENGQLVEILAIGCDITERKMIEEALRENQEYFRRITDVAPVILYIYDLENHCNQWSNRELLTVLGYTVQAFREAGSSLLQTLMHPEDYERYPAHYERLRRLGEGEAAEFEYRLRHSNGSWRWLHSREMVFARSADGTVTQIAGAATDITEHKKAEDALRRSEESVRLKLHSILSPEGDIGVLELADIIDAPAIQSLLEDCYQITRFPMSIIDLQGRVLVGVGWQEICTKFHRMHPQTLRHCIESDTQLTSDIPSGEYRLYKCKNNLLDMAAPILVGGQRVGHLFSGQFFFEGEIPERELFRAQARQYGFDEEAYLAALEAVPRLSREAVAKGMSFFMKLANLLSLLSFRNIQLARTLAERDALMASLRESEANLRLALDSAQMGTFDYRPDSGEIVCNERARSIYGLVPGERLRYGEVLARIHPEDRMRVHRTVQTALEPEESGRFESEFRIVWPDGSVHWSVATGRVYYEGEGEERRGIRMTGIQLDITERKQAELRLRRFFDSGVVGMIYWTMDGAITDANDRFLDMIGYGREDLQAGRIDWVNLTPPEYRSLDEHAFHELKTTGVDTAYEKEYIRKDGSRIPVIVGAAMLDETGPEGVAFVLDITERKVTEEALREADRRKDVFLAILGHELRNPVATITSAVTLLNRPNRSAEKEAWTRNTIVEQSRQLCRIVDDLLDVSRIARGKIQLEMQDVPIEAVVEKSLESVRESCEALRHRLTVDCPEKGLTLVGDPARLQQILVNLLSNACKYTPEGGQICLSVRSEEDHVVLRVIDNGIGISPENLPRLFEMFSQVESAKHKSQGGLGVGLSLVKMLAEMHGGSVSVKSEEGRGSRFEVRLPKNNACPVRASFPDTRPDLPVTGLQILVVEDNQALAHMLADTLAEQGHVLQHAHDGLEALTIARQQRPDVVLLDIGLPKIDGYEVARRLRNELGLKETLIIAATAWGQERDRERSAAAGINHHLVKPVDDATVSHLIGQWMGGRGL